MRFTQSGSSFGGTLTSSFGEQQVDEGQVNGRVLTWRSTIQFGGQSMTLSYRAEVDGNRMSGTAELGSFGNSPFTAERTP
jgi:hypothetical protein